MTTVVLSYINLRYLCGASSQGSGFYRAENRGHFWLITATTFKNWTSSCPGCEPASMWCQQLDDTDNSIPNPTVQSVLSILHKYFSVSAKEREEGFSYQNAIYKSAGSDLKLFWSEQNPKKFRIDCNCWEENIILQWPCYYAILATHQSHPTIFIVESWQLFCQIWHPHDLVLQDLIQRGIT